MSAFIVPDMHIQALVGAALEFSGNMHYYDYPWSAVATKTDLNGNSLWIKWQQEHEKWVNVATANDTGNMLMDANQASITARYEGRWPQEAQEPFAFKFSYITMLDPIKIMGAIRCFNYQACEVSNYELTEASLFNEALTELCIARISESHETPWTVEELDDVRLDEFKGGREIRSLTQLMGGSDGS
jgi:hypothetical protein